MVYSPYPGVLCPSLDLVLEMLGYVAVVQVELDLIHPERRSPVIDNVDNPHSQLERCPLFAGRSSNMFSDENRPVRNRH